MFASCLGRRALRWGGGAERASPLPQLLAVGTEPLRLQRRRHTTTTTTTVSPAPQHHHRLSVWLPATAAQRQWRWGGGHRRHTAACPSLLCATLRSQARAVHTSNITSAPASAACQPPKRPLAEGIPCDTSASTDATRQDAANPASATSQKPGAAAAEASQPEGGKEEEESDGGFLEAWRSCSKETRWGLGVVAFCTALESVGVGMIVPFLPGLADDLGLGAMGVGLVISAASCGKVVANMPAGWFADNIGRRPIMIWGQVLTAFGIFCTAIAPNLAALFLARFTVGVGSSAGAVASSAYTVDITSDIPKHRGLLIGLIGSIATLAYVIGPAAGGLVASYLGDRGPFYFFSAVTLMTTVAYVTVRETLVKKPAAPAEMGPEGIVKGDALQDAAKGAAAGEGGSGAWDEAKTALADYKELSGDTAQRALVMLNICASLGWASYLTLLPLHASLVWGATPAQLGVAFSVASGVGLMGAPLAGRFADTHGRMPVLLVGSVLNCVGCALLYFSSNYTEFMLALVMWEIGEAALAAILVVLAADLAPANKRGQSLSLQRQAGDVALLIAPLMLGVISDCMIGTAGGLAASAFVTAGFSVTAVVLLRRVFKNLKMK